MKMKLILLAGLLFLSSGCATVCPPLKYQLLVHSQQTQVTVKQVLTNFFNEAIGKLKPQVSNTIVFLTGDINTIVAMCTLETVEEEKGILFKVRRSIFAVMTKTPTSWKVAKINTNILHAEKIGISAGNL